MLPVPRPAFGLGIAIVVPMVLRNERRARRFLAEHPEPDPLPG
ncbi:hypothetical protein [Blastococcus sp. SYSU DS0533]